MEDCQFTWGLEDLVDILVIGDTMGMDMAVFPSTIIMDFIMGSTTVIGKSSGISHEQIE